MPRNGSKNRLLDAEVQRIYGKYCHGMQLSIMRIPELFRLARIQLECGADPDGLGLWMREYVKQNEGN